MEVHKKTKKKLRHIDLIRELAITDFKIKYQGSVLGYVWSLAKPLAMFGVLYLVFTVFVRVGSTIPHYALYLLLGIVLWNYFAETTMTSMRSISDKGDMMRKVYFPRITIILSASISSTITLLLNMIVVIIFLIFARINPGFGIFYFISQRFRLRKDEEPPCCRCDSRTRAPGRWKTSRCEEGCAQRQCSRSSRQGRNKKGFCWRATD